MSSTKPERPSRGRDPGLRLRIETAVLPDKKEEESPETDSDQSSPQQSKFKFTLPDNLKWIPSNWTLPKVRPVIRSAVAAWISSVLFIIPAVERYMGQVSAFLSPPADPFIGVVEREVIIIGIVALVWGWSCFGMFLANLARSNTDPTVTFVAAISGQYIEAGPTVIIAVFIFLGSVFLLYLRARQGPGPYLFACILGCICLDITLTAAILIPYPYYKLGRSIIIPLGFHSAISVLVSILIFPQTVSAEFTTRLQGVLAPLIKSLELQCALKQNPADSKEFASIAEQIKASVRQAEAGLIPLAITARLLPSDLIYARFAPTDFKSLQAIARRMAVRANGLTIYFALIEPTRERFPMTPIPSRPVTPGATPGGTPGATTPGGSPGATTPQRMSSRPASPERQSTTNTDAEDDQDGWLNHHRKSRTISCAPHVHHLHHHHHHHHGPLHNLLHNSLLHLSLSRAKNEQAVGVFESQRYMDIEATMFHDPDAIPHTQQAMNLLFHCCDPLLKANRSAVSAISDWLRDARRGRFAFWRSAKQKKTAWQTKFDTLKKTRDDLEALLKEFKSQNRFEVLEPYKPVLEAKGDVEQDSPSHRYLFHCYVYQYHLMRFTAQIIEMLDEIIRLEQERPRNHIWTPARKLFTWNNWNLSDINDDEEDPHLVQGLDPSVMDDLGMANKRDPDALPPHNVFEWVMNQLYMFFRGCGGGNALYAVKAGILTVIMFIPSFLTTSAEFAYENRFVWAIIMAQLTLARFRGDTTFGWVARVLSTFLGGIVGSVIWYISAGSGHGSPYGLAAVLAVCYPFFFYARLYWPGPPMTNIIFFVTTVLVIGYSYQDHYIILPGNPGSGIDVAWRRFVLVTVGVTAAFIFSFLPPATTIRRYQRTLLATTSSELGAIYCSVISFASSRRLQEVPEVVTSLIAIRSKLSRSAVLRTNAIYEFSLRGRWPAERYKKILDLQMQIAYSLSHLMSIMEHMEPSWTRAFLVRTRFLDPNFQGDLLAVISMISTSLRTGDPLPQITPCPLVDRFMLKYHGFSVIHKEAEEDFGLPRTLTLETLQDEQYLMFCVGVSTAFGIVSRLDRLMLAVKEIVGEQYHLHGVSTSFRVGVEMGSRTNTLTLRTPNGV
ncbi:hypothetical protein BDZ89DRAFT_1066048 [Hymenopellis radicata]|nr:hypothetical protein BDZ89DRAFT_1066048 [Hymenopellis radicata]